MIFMSKRRHAGVFRVLPLSATPVRAMVVGMPDSDHDSDDYTLMRPTAAAALVGVHVRTLARWSDEGRLPVRRTRGGKRRYRRADVIALTEQPA